MEHQDQNLRGQKEKSGEAGGTPQGGRVSAADHQAMEALGFRQGQLFTSPERLTLTFFMGDQVASIHFDLFRREIFFKGHNVKNMTLTPDQWLALGNFSKLIKSEGCPPKMVVAYEECLGQIPPRL
jgi:hypothetical protein